MTLLVYDISLLAKRRGSVRHHWLLSGAAEKLRVETGTDIVNEQVNFLGWETREDPQTEDEKRWFDEGRHLSTEAVIELARAENPGRLRRARTDQRRGSGGPVMSRLPRPRVTNDQAQRMSTSTRFWKPMSQKMWIASQSSQAGTPVTRKRRKSATARSRPIVASSP